MLGTASNTSHHILQTLTQLKINGRKQRQSDEKQENQLRRYLNQNYLVRLYFLEAKGETLNVCSHRNTMSDLLIWTYSS